MCRSLIPSVVFFATVAALGALASPSHAVEKHGDLYVLTIGVEPSLNAQGKRDWYARDAHYMAETLVSAAPLYETVHSRILAGNQATRRQVATGIQWLARSVGKNDVAIVFISAHGELNSSKEYEITLAHQTLAGGEFRKSLANIAGRVIVLVDTCHAGALVSKEAEPNVSYLVACQSDELSYGQWKDPEMAHGYFVIALRKGLRGSADKNRDGIVTFGELAAFVPAHATTLCPQQHGVLAQRSNASSVSVSKADPAFQPSEPTPASSVQASPNAATKRRNPFAQADVPNPRGEDVLKFAATVRLLGKPDDANAVTWNAKMQTASAAKLDGEWESRWNHDGAVGQWWSGESQIETVGDRVFILYRDGSHTYLTEAQWDGKDRLVGRYVNVLTPSDTSPWVGRIVNPYRIDGQWKNGRWDLRRKMSSN